MIMQKLISAALAASLMVSTAAFAQTTAPSTPPASPAPVAAEKKMTPPASASEVITLTDAQAKGWIDKAVYSSDGKNVGEVVAFTRDGSGKVREMHADIGGFLGLGQTRVRLQPSQFKLMDDRVVLSITAEQTKALPKIQS
jgi:PRC-barrel domain